MNKKTLSYLFNWMPLDVRKYIFEFIIPDQSKIFFLHYVPRADDTNYHHKYTRAYVNNSFMKIKYRNKNQNSLS